MGRLYPLAAHKGQPAIVSVQFRPLSNPRAITCA